MVHIIRAPSGPGYSDHSSKRGYECMATPSKLGAKLEQNFSLRSSGILRKPDSATFQKLPTPNRRTLHVVVRSRRGPLAKRCAWIKLSSPSARAPGLQVALSHARQKCLEFPLPHSQREWKRPQGRAPAGHAPLSLLEFQIRYFTHEPNC